MEPGTTTVAQLLKKSGYATAIVGKWGLGMPEDHSSALDFGFEYFQVLVDAAGGAFEAGQVRVMGR